MYYWNGSHLEKDAEDVTWNVNKLLGKTKGYNEDMGKILDSAFKTDKEMNFTPTRNYKAKGTLRFLRYH